MIKSYLAERRSWLAFYVFLHGFILLIAYLDAAIPFEPVLYIVFISSIFFVLFLTWRYQKETKYFRKLHEWGNDFDLDQIATATSPFEKIVEESIMSQTNELKRTTSLHRTAIEQEKDELTSWIHEVKTPLSAMRLIIDRVDDVDVRTSLTHEWLRIHLLLDQQLYLKRLPHMENDLLIDTVDLENVLFTEIKTLQSWCIHKGIGFELRLDVKEVSSDGKWLAFMIRQLVTNAVKYSDPGAPDIIVTTGEQGGQTFLKVQDFGRGIDPKDVPRIFDKGFTSTTNPLDRGATGMGLYLLRKAADTLKIRVAVQSEPGAGTSFTLIFPSRNEFMKITSM